MQLDCPALDCFIPDGVGTADASGRTTQLGIGAHPDDLEIIAIPGILSCIDSPNEWFTGVVTCDGAGSPRTGRYAGFSDRQLADTRRQEQRDAAALGGYSLQIQLGFPSGRADSPELVDCLENVLRECRPDTVFLHNPADAHATHRRVARSSLAALQRLSAAQRPTRIYGVEVWRSLDWLPAQYRAVLPVEDPQALQARLLGCHDSQVSGGKRYDQAIIARQRANATLLDSHEVDRHDACILAMDLMPLLDDTGLDLDTYLTDALASLRDSLLA